MWSVHLVATHLAIDATRARKVARRYAPQLIAPDSTESAEDRYLETELQRRVATAVAALPAYQREVMQAYAEGARNSEIAQRIGRPVDVVKQVISRTLKQLRQQLRDAELAVIALWTRRRRSGAVPAGAVSPFIPAAGPAMAVVVSAAMPLMGCLVAFVVSTGDAAGEPRRADPGDHVTTTSNVVKLERVGLAPSDASPGTTPLVQVPSALEPAQEATAAQMDETFRRMPRSTSVSPGRPGDLRTKGPQP